MSAAYLDWMLGWLRSNGYRIAPLGEVVQAMRESSAPPRLVAITFDDGYQDFLTHALPVLEAHRCPATVFAVSGLLGGQNEWDAGYLPTAPLMTAADLRQIAGRGIDIGSHGRSHLRLARLPDAERIVEIEGSRRDLENLLQRDVSWFAYPFVDHDVSARRQVQAAGYAAAFGGEQALHERFALHRVAIGETPPPWLALKLLGVSFRARRTLPLRFLSRVRASVTAAAGQRT